MSVATAMRALLISPRFFGYEDLIADELRNQSYTVDFIDERPSNRPVSRAIVRVRKSLIAGTIAKYYQSRLAEMGNGQYDLVLVIKAEIVPRWFLDELRKRNPAAHFVFYSFDSIGNSSNCLDVLDCFDRKLSFDRRDVASLDGLAYQPLFYAPQFNPVASGDQPRHEISFIGTLHSDRYAFTRALFGEGSGTFAFFYVQARWYFALNKYLLRRFREVPWSHVSFAPMSRDDVAKTFAASRAVLDIQRTGQDGLTMRTFEVLASGAILVTTNEAIRLEAFYDPDRILVIPDELDLLSPTAIRRKLADMPDPVRPIDHIDDYSLSSWVRDVVARRTHRNGQP